MFPEFPRHKNRTTNQLPYEPAQQRPERLAPVDRKCEQNPGCEAQGDDDVDHEGCEAGFL